MSEQPRESLVCPSCGAMLPVEASRAAVVCAQCGHSSAPAPRVQTIVVERVVVEGAPGKSLPQLLQCPRCKASLYEGLAHGVIVLGCDVCGGVFLDNAASTAILRRNDVEIAAIAVRATRRAVAAFDTSVAELRCPRCPSLLQRVTAQGVDLDICQAHGTWFDSEELIRIMAPMQEEYVMIPNPALAREAALREAKYLEGQAFDRAVTTTSVVAGLTFGALRMLSELAGSRN
jgi:Zn-finger nucleic acid-binding protein